MSDIAVRDPETLLPLLAPKAIALVGASAARGKLGWAMGESLRSFPGIVHHINKSRADPERSVFNSVTEAASMTGVSPDLAVMCVPASATVGAVREAAAAGVKVAIVCAGGFAETGAAGVMLQSELATVCRETGIRILGPNTSGIIVPAAGMIASFVPGLEVIREGRVVVLAASGGVNHALAFALANRHIGLRLAVGLGNSVDIDMADILEALVHDTATGLIALHIESIGDGRRIVEAVAQLADRIPVVVSVIGRSDISEFAKSHTGALAAPWRTTRAALRHAGAVIADDERELVDAVTALSLVRLPRRSTLPGVGVVTGQAGPGLILTDALRHRGVHVPALSSTTVEGLKQLLPDLTFQQNPVDTGRPGETFEDIVRTVSADESINLTVVYGLIEPDALDLPKVLTPLDWYDVPVIAVTGGPAHEVELAQQRFIESGIPSYDTPAAAAVGVRAVSDDATRPSWIRRTAPGLYDLPAIPTTNLLDEFDAKRLLQGIGVRVPQGFACDSDDELRLRFGQVSPPAVLKVLDARIIHKTDVGGVYLSIKTVNELETAILALRAMGATRFLLEEMAPAGLDLLISARRDPLFGPMVTLAMGGTDAELFDDVAMRLAPLDREDAASMRFDLKMRPLLEGWRGAAAVDMDPVWRIICDLGQLIMNEPSLSEIEINPLRVGVDSDPIALDAVILFKEEL